MIIKNAKPNKREEEEVTTLTLNAFNAIFWQIAVEYFVSECANLFLGSRWDHAMLSLTAPNPMYF